MEIVVFRFARTANMVLALRLMCANVIMATVDRPATLVSFILKLQIYTKNNIISFLSNRLSAWILGT